MSLSTETTPTAAAARTAHSAFITPEDKLKEEIKRLKAKVARMEMVHKKTVLAAVKLGGKMTLKRIENEHGHHRANEASMILSVMKTNIWPAMKILNNNWPKYNSKNEKNLCSILMKKVTLYDGDNEEIIWTVIMAPAVCSWLNNKRASYLKEAKNVFNGEEVLHELGIKGFAST